MSDDTPKPDARPSVHCTFCRSYFITYDRAKPHACRAFGIASTRLPMHDVRENSGRDCEAFEPKSARS